MIYKTVIIYVCYIILTLTTFSVLSKNQVKMFLRDDVYEDYVSFLAGRDPLEITSFRGHNIRRDVVDMIIAQQALKLGGFNKNFKYKVGKINFRNTKLLEQGALLLSFDTYWLSDAKELKEKVYISSPVIKKGQYLAGVFANPTNEKVFSIQSLSDFKGLTSVSTPRWRTDWYTLMNLPLKEVFQEHEWLGQTRMVHLKWADFMLMPFMPARGNVYKLENIELKAVPGIAVILDDSRHFVISKKHPDGLLAYKALQVGLNKLRKQGLIMQAYKEAGFIPEKGSVKVLNQ